MARPTDEEFAELARKRDEAVSQVVDAICKEKGWDQITNGDLIIQAETLFDVFVSTDQNLKYQQNLKNRKIAILVLPTTSWRKLEQNAATIKSALDTLKLGQYLEISF